MLTSAEINKTRNFAIKCCCQQNFKKFFCKMTLLMMCIFGPNFISIPLAKLELLRKQILLMSAFFGFCGFSRKWGRKQLGNTPTGKLHHGTLHIQSLVCSFSTGECFPQIMVILIFLRHTITYLHHVKWKFFLKVTVNFFFFTGKIRIIFSLGNFKFWAPLSLR